MKRLMITGSVVVVCILGIIAYRMYVASSLSHKGIACTMEARRCPDGTYVGRTGPKCEFQACPGFVSFDYRNATFGAGETQVKFTNGISFVKGTEGEGDLTTTRILGYEAMGDVDGDGAPDIAFIVTRNFGGSGTFYSVAVALSTKQSAHTVQWYSLGDRIQPLSNDIRDGVIHVQYRTHRANESFAQEPTLLVTTRLIVRNDALIEAQ